MAAVKRYSNQPIDNLVIEQSDFEASLKTVQPTAKREGFAVIPDVSWEDIGSLQQLRQELYNCIVLPIQNPELFKHFSVRPPAGVLLWGPPGCGKTLLAKVAVQINYSPKAVANASRANFIAIKGPELLNKYVGESEKAIRNVRPRPSQYYSYSQELRLRSHASSFSMKWTQYAPLEETREETKSPREW